MPHSAAEILISWTDIEQVPPWALTEPTEAILKAWNKPLETASMANRDEQGRSLSLSPSQIERLRAPNCRETGHLSPMRPSGPRIPKERLQRARCITPQPVPWVTFAGESTRLDRLQQESYFKDVSIIEPGQKPDDPQFGHYTQNVLTVEPNMPTMFAHATTPSDNEELRKQNRFLLN